MKPVIFLALSILLASIDFANAQQTPDSRVSDLVQAGKTIATVQLTKLEVLV
jgi:hypothetical protein